MRFVMFYHSLVSDWNHGNAHFLRGICTELLDVGHTVEVYEPFNGWSCRNLVEDQGIAAATAFYSRYPRLRSRPYDQRSLSLDAALDGADVVIVHEWNDPEWVARIGRHHRRSNYLLLFHDTHHRAVSAPHELAAYDLSDFDGVLAFGEVLRDVYESRGWAARAWTWHEAADTRIFEPLRSHEPEWDLVWVGNWGDGERAAELQEFLIEPVGALGLQARVHGVRYPDQALMALRHAGIDYRGWLANFDVPRVFGRSRTTVHVPRRFYREQLPGIPTIRMFEALACGIPLVSAPWTDSEGLFKEGRDYLLARNGREMRDHLELLCADTEFALQLASHALATIRERHTCAHRVRELLSILSEAGLPCNDNSTSPSSDRASCQPTGTGPPRTIAGSSVPWPGEVTG